MSAAGLGSSLQRGYPCEECSRVLKTWNDNNFGNIQKKIKELKRRLGDVKCLEGSEGIRREEVRVSEELDSWLVREETMWHQRSRILWLNEGDINTKFFTPERAIRRKRTGYRP
ncbi:hypothetical protein QQ045_000587 [Rhodiola kirilowii]